MGAHIKIATEEGETPWRGLSCDVSWEAGDSGVIRCRTVLNRRSDVFQAVEGLNLRDIRCETRSESAFDLLQDGHLVRNVAMRLPRNFGPDRLYLTAQRLPAGNTIGIFCAVEARFDEALRGQAHLLSQVTQAK